MRPKFVAQTYVKQVLDGLEAFYQKCLETDEFNADDMLNFMEPIFTNAGYRQPTVGNSRINILLIHDAGVGDFIMMSAAIRELRRIYPTAHITLMIRQNANSIAEHCPYVDEMLMNISPNDWREFPQVYRRNQKMAAELLSRRYDMAFAFTHYPSAILLAYMSGARERISHHFDQQNEAFEIGPLFAFAPLVTVEADKWIFGTHSIESNLALLSAVTRAPIINREPEIWYTPGDYAATAEFFRMYMNPERKVYALCLGGMSYRKMYPPEKYAQLVQMIVEREPDINFVILGAGPVDVESATKFKQSLDEDFVKDHIFDLTNAGTYRMSAVMLKFCDMYIGNDTGTMHMAATVKTPVLSPSCFATDLDVRYNVLDIYYPYGVPSVTVLVKNALPECKEARNGVGCVIEAKPHCITQIEPDTMYAAYEMLKERIAQNIIEPLFVS